MPINYKDFFKKPYLPKSVKDFIEKYEAENMTDEQQFFVNGIRRMFNADKLQTDIRNSEKE